MRIKEGWQGTTTAEVLRDVSRVERHNAVSTFT
jgi:hypothetical protein